LAGVAVAVTPTADIPATLKTWVPTVPRAYVKTTVITARPLTKKDLNFSMAFTIARLNADRVGVRKPIERSYPSINRYCVSTLAAAQDPRAPPYRIR